MIPNPYEAPRGPADAELDRGLLARRIFMFLVLTGALVALSFLTTR